MSPLADLRGEARHHQGATVLLVEDEDAMREVLRLGLVACGFQVLEASNGH